MKKFSIKLAMLALALVLGLVLSGCATTSSINYAATTQPSGEYKHVAVKVSGFAGIFGNTSVLQRFYEQYPSTQYEVIAYEKTAKPWLPTAGAVAGAILGLFIGYSMEVVSETNTQALSIAFPVGLAAIGGFTGNMFSSNYVITYVER